MNGVHAVLVAATVIAAGVGPFVAVHIGGKAFDSSADDEPEHDEPDDDTIELPRAADGPYRY